MEFEGIGVIRYGELRFVFEMTEAVSKFLTERGISPESMFPKTQFFYQGVLMKMGVSHEEEKELRVIFVSIKNDSATSHQPLATSFEGEEFENFPIHVGEEIYFSDFVVEARGESPSSEHPQDSVRNKTEEMEEEN